jgi:hypothetical protein
VAAAPEPGTLMLGLLGALRPSAVSFSIPEIVVQMN